MAVASRRLAEQNARNARREADRASRLPYVASMNLAPAEWDNHNAGHVRELLRETTASPGRGFEWGY
jgi:hypothetical protein